jgi:hypothetical protein
VSSKLGKLATQSSLTLRDSLLSLYSPPKNTRSPWVETWSFWCFPNVLTFQTALRQTTLFIVKLLIVSSPICSNLVVTWLIGQKQLCFTIDLKFHNVGIELNSERS